IVGLIVDETPESVSSRPGSPPVIGRDGPVGWAVALVTRTIDRATRPAGAGVAVLKATAGRAARPGTTARGAVNNAWRVLQAARDDVLPRAPQSALNGPISSRRT